MAQKPGPGHFRGGADSAGRHRRAEAGLHELRVGLLRLPDFDHVGAAALAQPAQVRDEPGRPVPGPGLRVKTELGVHPCVVALVDSVEFEHE